MKISAEKQGDATILRIDGRIDTSTAPDFENAVLREIENETAELIFDYSKVEYMSSAGIRVIMAADSALDGRIRLIHVNDEIMDIFDMTGLIDLLNIE